MIFTELVCKQELPTCLPNVADIKNYMYTDLHWQKNYATS